MFFVRSLLLVLLTINTFADYQKGSAPDKMKTKLAQDNCKKYGAIYNPKFERCECFGTEVEDLNTDKTLINAYSRPEPEGFDALGEHKPQDLNFCLTAAKAAGNKYKKIYFQQAAQLCLSHNAKVEAAFDTADTAPSSLDKLNKFNGLRCRCDNDNNKTFLLTDVNEKYDENLCGFIAKKTQAQANSEDLNAFIGACQKAKGQSFIGNNTYDRICLCTNIDKTINPEKTNCEEAENNLALEKAGLMSINCNNATNQGAQIDGDKKAFKDLKGKGPITPSKDPTKDVWGNSLY